MGVRCEPIISHSVTRARHYEYGCQSCVTCPSGQTINRCAGHNEGSSNRPSGVTANPAPNTDPKVTNSSAVLGGTSRGEGSSSSSSIRSLPPSVTGTQYYRIDQHQ